MKKFFSAVTAEVVRRKPYPQLFFFFFVGLMISYFSVPANAFPNGVSGYSGKSGSICTSCHSTGAAPAITWSGPTSVNSGSTANFTLTVGGGGNGGLDVAATAGTFTAGAGTQVMSGEITQTSATSTHSWTFAWTAPTVTANTVVTVYGAAIDGAAGGTGTTKQSITVMAAAPPPPPPPPPPATSALSVSPSSLAFSYTPGGTNPAGQTLSVSSSGAMLNYTVSKSGSTWLSAMGGGNTPGSVSVTVNPAGLNSGTYNGSVIITSTTASNSPKTIPVTLTVNSTTPPPPPPPPTTGGTLTVSTSRLVFYADGTESPSPKTISVSSGSQTSFTAAVYGGSWASVNSSGGTTPKTLSVSAYATGLPAGTYACVLQIKAGSSVKNVAIVLVVGSGQSGGGGDDAREGAQVRPFTFDPGALGTSSATWQSGAGALRSNYDPGNQGLVLLKGRFAPQTAIAGAIVKGAAGSRISTLGFDIRTDSECSGQAPQFVVTTSDNVVHTAGCMNGSNQMLSAAGWKRVTFNTANRTQVIPPIQPGMTIKTVALVMDHIAGNGFAVLDNINLNSLYIGKQ